MSTSRNVMALVLVMTTLGMPMGLVAQQPAKTDAAGAAVKVPDTPAGRALKEFVESFNAGGEKRKAWVEERTTAGKDGAADILQQDATFLSEHGKMTIVRIPKASAENIEAIVRHDTSGAHGHLTLDVDAAAPYKITNMRLRPAAPDEIKGL